MKNMMTISSFQVWQPAFPLRVVAFATDPVALTITARDLLFTGIKSVVLHHPDSDDDGVNYILVLHEGAVITLDDFEDGFRGFVLVGNLTAPWSFWRDRLTQLISANHNNDASWQPAIQALEMPEEIDVVG